MLCDWFFISVLYMLYTRTRKTTVASSFAFPSLFPFPGFLHTLVSWAKVAGSYCAGRNARPPHLSHSRILHAMQIDYSIGLIGTRIQASDSYQFRWLRMILKHHNAPPYSALCLKNGQPTMNMTLVYSNYFVRDKPYSVLNWLYC